MDEFMKEAFDVIGWTGVESDKPEMDKVEEECRMARVESIAYYEKKYGSVEFKGKKFVITSQAYITNRLLQSGIQETHFEMSASALDETGKEYTVYWIFENVEEQELDGYDYDDVDRVEVA